jgi:hypothetical protein
MYAVATLINMPKCG